MTVGTKNKSLLVRQEPILRRVELLRVSKDSWATDAILFASSPTTKHVEEGGQGTVKRLLA